MAVRTIDELKALIKDSTVLQDVIDSIESEKERGIAEKSKVNKEAQNLRRFKKSFDALGYGDETDLDEFTAALLEAKNRKSDDSGKDSLTLKTLNQQIEQLRKERDEERKRAKTDKLNAKLTEALSEKLIGARYVINTLISDGKCDIVDGEVVFKLDGAEYAFSDGIQKVLESNKELLRTSQKPGANTSPSGGVASPGSSEALLKSTDPAVIAANLSKIKESLGMN